MSHTQAREAQHRAPPPAPPPVRGRRLRRVIRAAVHTGLRPVVETRPGLAAVNRLHRALSLRQKRRLFYCCFDLSCRVDGPWAVDFAGRRLVLPLRRDFELAWLAAIGFHGYDTEMHELYEALVRAPRPPRVVFDVGAGYGLHSLRLLAHGARVVSFEPNTACHPFFAACGRHNDVQPDIRPVAVGDASGHADLWLPDGRTWLGTTTAPVARAWGAGVQVERRRVQQVALDDIVKNEALVPDVVKIDTEGGELKVLAGARAILENARPLLVLESWPGSSERVVLFALLTSYGYRLRALHFGAAPSVALTLPDFVRSTASNFTAHPLAA